MDAFSDKQSEQEIELHLDRYAKTYAYSKGYKFGAGADNDIKRMAGQAASNIVNPTKDEYKNVDMTLLIAVTEKHFGIFIDHMIISRKKVYSDLSESDKVLGEMTFEWAKRLICPIYPLC